MSIYRLNKLLYQVAQDPSFREAFGTNPSGATHDYGLSSDERQALLQGDVVALYRMGVHPFLLFHLARFRLVELDEKTYVEKITGGKGQRLVMHHFDSPEQR